MLEGQGDIWLKIMMASDGNNSSPNEKAIQTYDSMQRSPEAPDLKTIGLGMLSATLSSLSSHNIDGQKPDGTRPKEVDSSPRTPQGDTIPDDTRPKEVEPSKDGTIKDTDGGQTEGPKHRPEEIYLHHQCANAGDILPDGEHIHRPKQEGRPHLCSTQSSEHEEELIYLRRASGGGDGSVFCPSLSSSLSSSFTMCDRCSAAYDSLRCVNSKEFWEGVEGSKLKCCERLWKHFQTRMKSLFPKEDGFHNNRVMTLLKTLLDVTGELDVVHIDKFLRLVKFFGPFRPEENRCVVLKQLEDLITHSSSKDAKTKRKKSWFAGPMTRTEAELKLKEKCPGTFLIRMSESEQDSGSFVASLVMEDSSIEHFILQGHPEKAIGSDPFESCLEFRGKTFASLPELVNGYLREEEICEEGFDNAQRCSIVCPDLPFNHVINGYAK